MTTAVIVGDKVYPMSRKDIKELEGFLYSMMRRSMTMEELCRNLGVFELGELEQQLSKFHAIVVDVIGESAHGRVEK